jgi:hypothetical protein
MFLLWALLPLASAAHAQEQSTAVDFSKLDIGDYATWQKCSAQPRGAALSSKEKCEVESLRARCNAADDCLVTCISSPDGRNVGGGCAHVCFDTLHNFREWKEPAGWGQCSTLREKPSDAKAK